MKTRSQKSAAGHSWVSNLFWLLVAIIMLVVSYRLISPIYHEYYLSKKVEDICRNGAQRSQTKIEDLQNEILDLAVKEKIPLKLENIEIKKTGNSVIIILNYEETVNLWVTKWTRKVNIEKNSSEMSF